jgi:hypothetical protein
MKNPPPITRFRHAKDVPEARCCWVCGKVGGSGFTHALRLFGYDTSGQIGYAHNRCIDRLKKQSIAKAEGRS